MTRLELAPTVSQPGHPTFHAGALQAQILLLHVEGDRRLNPSVHSAKVKSVEIEMVELPRFRGRGTAFGLCDD